MKKLKTLQFKCSEDERAKMVNQAKKENFPNFSSWARKVLLDRMGRIMPNSRPLAPEK